MPLENLIIPNKLNSMFFFLFLSQVRLIGRGASSLLALNMNSAFSIPNQLYHDIQCTFIDTIYCIAKLQISAPEESFYTALNGTDPEVCSSKSFRNIYLLNGTLNLTLALLS